MELSPNTPRWIREYHEMCLMTLVAEIGRLEKIEKDSEDKELKLHAVQVASVLSVATHMMKALPSTDEDNLDRTVIKTLLNEALYGWELVVVSADEID